MRGLIAFVLLMAPVAAFAACPGNLADCPSPSFNTVTANTLSATTLSAGVTVPDGADVAEGAKADPAWTSGPGSVIALLKAAIANIQSPGAVYPSTLTLTPLDAASVTTGGTAVVALTAGHRSKGGFLKNPDAATASLCINETGTASGTTTSGSTICIAAGQTYQLVPSANAVSVVASDSSHAFGGYGFQ